MLWFMVAVPTPETGSCLGRKRVEKGHSPTPTSGFCIRYPFHNQGSSHWASREQLSWGWGLERQEEIHRPQPTQDIQGWYTGTMWSRSRKRLLVRGTEKGMVLANLGPVSTEVVFYDLCICVYDYMRVCFCTGDFMCMHVRQ